MTTAGRPTWSTAVGSERGQYKMYTPTMQHSAKDERGHLHLKTRQPGQNTQEELKKKDLKEKLEAEEKAYFDKQKRPEELLKLNAPSLEAPKALPTPVVYDADDSSSDDSSSDDDSDAETAELMRELERIKKGRELEQAKLEQEKLERDARENADAVLRSNPLLDGGAVGDDSTVKRKWYDETVFKNQARDAPDAAGKKQKKTYVNDTIRNEFHRAFMNKYIK